MWLHEPVTGKETTPADHAAAKGGFVGAGHTEPPPRKITFSAAVSCGSHRPNRAWLPETSCRLLIGSTRPESSRRASWNRLQYFTCEMTGRFMVAAIAGLQFGLRDRTDVLCV